VLEGSRIPFSGGRLVNEQDAIELMDAVRDAISASSSPRPEELLQAAGKASLPKTRLQAEELLSQAPEGNGRS